jgi:WD40 repeat protein/serine/threonine protein kinase
MESGQKNIDTILSEAIEIASEAERQAYLDQVCGDDKELRREAERLVADHFEAGDFLEQPAAIPDATLGQPVTEKPGMVIGRYKLLEQIGEGGFGVVFMAEQEEPVRRKVALKIIKPGMDTKEVIARFEAERQALAIMDHPNIAKVLDAGATESGRPYFVMDLVPGIPITDFCDQNSLTTRERLELFASVCQAVQHAHQKGIIHRDVKPSNVLVTLRDDRPIPKVIDFGVAKATNQRLTEKTVFTQFAQMVGTPLYMSPEQAGMSELDVDTRSDIYSLGVLLYELLTGTTPFDQKRVREAAYDELLRIIREEEPPRPSLRISTLGDTLPSVAAHRKTEPKKLSSLFRGDLDWIVMKALEKDRTRRYETANGFANDIRRYLNDEPVVACPPSAAYRFRKFAQRNTAAIITSSVIALALVLGIVGTSWQAVLATRARKEEALQRVAAVAAQEEEAIARHEAEVAASRERQARRQIRRHLYVADMNRVQHAWDEGSLDCARELLKRHLPTAGREDLRSFEWYHFWQKCHPDVLTLNHGSRVHSAAFSPDGRTLATGNAEHTVMLWDAATGKLKQILKGHQGWVWSVAFSPDGRMLASGSEDRTVKLWDVSAGQLVTNLGAHESGVRCLAFSPKGEFLASRDRTVQLWHMAAEESKLSSTIPCRGLVDSVAFSPNGKLLAIGLPFGGFDTYDVDTGGRMLKVGGGVRSGGVRSIVFSPDGAMLAAGGGGGVRLWDSRTGRLNATLQELDRVVLTVAFSPDGKKLASGGYDRQVKLWSVPDSELITSYKGHSDWIQSITFSPDGSTLASASADGTTRLWNVTDHLPQHMLKAHVGRVRSIAFSPESRCVASGSDRGAVKLWDVTTGNLKQILTHGEDVGAVAFSPDGRLLASASRGRGIVKLWSMDAGELMATLKGRRDTPKEGWKVRWYSGVAFSPDGETLASAGMDESVELWDVSSEKQITTLRGHTGFVQSVAFSHQGDILASGGTDTTVKLWDLASGRLDSTLRGHSCAVWCVAFSPDGKTLASASEDHTVKLWNVKSGRLNGTLKGHADQVCSVTFSPDGNTLATGSVDYTIKLWDVRTAETKATLHGHTESVRSVAFSSDGKNLASGGYYNTVRLWRAAKLADGQTRYERAEQLLVDPMNPRSLAPDP